MFLPNNTILVEMSRDIDWRKSFDKMLVVHLFQEMEANIPKSRMLEPILRIFISGE